jgi:hypothetical protein
MDYAVYAPEQPIRAAITARTEQVPPAPLDLALLLRCVSAADLLLPDGAAAGLVPREITVGPLLSRMK